MKRIVTFLLVLVMVLSCIPAAAVPVQAASGYEYAWFPAPSMNLTQIAYESYSHDYQNAIDFAPGGNVFAPFTGKITYLDSRWGYAVLQSTDKVYYADGTLDYMTVAFMHDENIDNLYVGQIIPQGTAFYQAGGMGSGNPDAYADHVHLSVHRGHSTAITSAGKYGAGDVYAYDAFYVNSEMTPNIVNEGKMEAGNYMTNGAPSNWSGFWKNLTDAIPYLKDCTFYPSYVNITTPNASPIWNMPCSDSTSDEAEKIATTTAGAALTSTALYLNTAGNYWYRVTYNGVTGYIYGGNTSYVRASYADVNISDVVAPSQIVVGNTFAIGGTISSKYNILCSITADVCSVTTEEEMFSSYVDVNTKSYSLKGSTIDNEMTFNTLPVDTYIYRVGANVKNYSTRDGESLNCSLLYCGEYKKEFTVVSQSSGTANVTVTFNANGGSCSTGSTTVSSGSAVGNLPYATRSGYIFEGWFTAASGGTQITASSTFTSNTTIYAHWSSDYEDLGSGFYAALSHAESGNGIINAGSNVELGYYGGEDSIWYFDRNSDGTYTILSAVDGLALDVSNADYANATNIWVYERNDTNAQKWFLQSSGSGYILISVIAGKALDVQSNNGSVGTNVQLYERNGTGAQLMNITNAYQITYDAAGGTGAPDMQWKLHGQSITLSSTQPTNNGVEFQGWDINSTAQNVYYFPGDTFTLNRDTTLYAVWSCAHSYTAEFFPATCTTYAYTRYTCTGCGYSYDEYTESGYSEWSTAYPSGVDESLIDSKTQYRYSDYETTTSYDTILDGWSRVGSSWQQSGSGTVQYVKSWPSGFSASHNLFSTYNKTPKSASETETDKTTIGSDKVTGYLYYHWCRGTYTAGPINRTTKPSQEGEYNTFHAFYSTTNPSTLQSDTDGSVVYANAGCCTDSHWYFHTSVNTQSYTTYRNLFTYARWTDWSDWSDTVYTETDTRSVDTRTLYRYYAGGLADHVWENGYCVNCGETDPNYDPTPTGVHVQSVISRPGEIVSIPVYVTGNDGFAGFTLTIDHDSRMTLVDISRGYLLDTSDSGSFTINVSGRTVNWVDYKNINGDGVIFDLIFQLPDDAVDGECFNISIGLKEGLASNFVDENAASKNVFFVEGDVEMDVPSEIASGYSGALNWTLTNDGLLTFSGNGKMKNYEYKSEMPWYSYRDQISTVVLEEGITSIGDYAFYGMPNLGYIQIATTVTSIGNYAFKNCPVLDYVYLPNNLTSLGDSAFYACTSLSFIDIPASLWTVKDYTFKNCTALESVTFHEGNLQKISDGAFYNTALTAVSFPDCLGIIDGYSFKNCPKLSFIALGSGITQIREAAFYGSAISEITIPEGVTSIKPYAFKNCVNLRSVDLPSTLTIVDEAAFYACTALESLDLPDAVATIGNYAFRKCEALRSVSLGSGLVTIGECSFYGCENLISLNIPAQVTSIKPYAFKGCTGLEYVSLPGSLVTIGESAFHTCPSLSEVTIPAKVTTIGAYCFSGSTGIDAFYFLGNAPSIGSSSFNKITATAYYPGDNTTWTSAVKQNYGGSITWKAQ